MSDFIFGLVMSFIVMTWGMFVPMEAAASYGFFFLGFAGVIFCIYILKIIKKERTNEQVY